jgi:glycosyltransferase 2 family protein
VAHGRQPLHRVGEIAASVGRDTSRHPRLWLTLRVGVALLVVVFLVLAVLTQWDELREYDFAFSAIWLAPALGVLVALYILAGFGWDLTLRALGHELGFARAQAIWAKSLLARYVPGAVLTVASRVLLAERERVPRRLTVASMVYEQGLMLVSAVIVSSWVVIGDAQLGTTARVAVLAVAPLMLAVMHPGVFGPMANGVLRIFGRAPLAVLLPLRTVLSLLCFYLVVWAVFGLGAFFAARTVFELGFADLPAVTAAQALGYAAALVTLVFPGGLGVRDATFAVLLDRALPGGFAVAAAIAIAVRLVTTLVEMLYAGGAMILGRRSSSAAPHPLREAT